MALNILRIITAGWQKIMLQWLSTIISSLAYVFNMVSAMKDVDGLRGVTVVSQIHKKKACLGCASSFATETHLTFHSYCAWAYRKSDDLKWKIIPTVKHSDWLDSSHQFQV